MSEIRIERKLDDVHKTLDRARQESIKFRSLWEGDASAGHYVLRTPLGTLEGTYSVSGSVATFVVAKKPKVVPRILIEKVLDEFLKGG